MTSIQETISGALVKSDRAGRTRYTETYKAEVIAAYEQSGMSAPAFAEHCGVKYPPPLLHGHAEIPEFFQSEKLVEFFLTHGKAAAAPKK